MDMRSYSSSTMDIHLTSTSYSHLLYLNDDERAQYFQKPCSPKARPESVSFFSMTSSRCSTDSERFSFSEISTPSTRQSSIKSETIAMPKYADDHYPLITQLDPLSLVPLHEIPKEHSALFCAKQMACIHNTIIRALNSSYNHANNILPYTQRCSDFVKFNQILFNTLEHHHHMEDNFLFPEFEKLLGRPGAVEENARGHESFMHGLREYQRYIFGHSVIEQFDAAHFRKIIKSFAADLIRHLHDEIPSILKMYVADSKQVRKIWTKAHKTAGERTDRYVDGPFMLGCQDRSFLLEGETCEFPGIPWMLETLVRNWHAKKHAGVWEFCPSDLHGNRRMLIA